jgi:hypothetical protein
MEVLEDDVSLLQFALLLVVDSGRALHVVLLPLALLLSLALSLLDFDDKLFCL